MGADVDFSLCSAALPPKPAALSAVWFIFATPGIFSSCSPGSATPLYHLCSVYIQMLMHQFSCGSFLGSWCPEPLRTSLWVPVLREAEPSCHPLYRGTKAPRPSVLGSPPVEFNPRSYRLPLVPTFLLSTHNFRALPSVRPCAAVGLVAALPRDPGFNQTRRDPGLETVDCSVAPWNPR